MRSMIGQLALITLLMPSLALGAPKAPVSRSGDQGQATPPPKPKQAPAQRTTQLSPKNTKLNFQAYSRLIDADGSFGAFKGSVTITGADVQTAQIKVVVDIGSLNTGIDKRDQHLRNADFFHVSKWPKAVFTSTGIKEIAKDKYEVKGRLVMMGKTVPLSFPADIWLTDKGEVRAKADFKMDRRRWGMTGYMSSWGVNPIKPSVRIHFQVKE